jgi:hypothetical protein
VYLPQLARTDLRVEAGKVTAFLGECALLREHLDAITAEMDLAGQPGIWNLQRLQAGSEIGERLTGY